MKKSISQLLALTMTLCAFVPAVEAAPSAATVNKSNAKVQAKYDVIKEDQNSGTDTLAIPLDESEFEDEELIDRLEGTDTFPIPRSGK